MAPKYIRLETDYSFFTSYLTLLYVYIDISICNLNGLVDKMNSCLKMKMKVEEEMSFMKNGRLLLEELIAFCNGKSNPILVLSAEEYKRVTNSYDKHQCILWEFKLYKDSLKEHFQLKNTTHTHTKKKEKKRRTRTRRRDFLLWKTLRLALLKKWWWDDK